MNGEGAACSLRVPEGVLGSLSSSTFFVFELGDNKISLWRCSRCVELRLRCMGAFMRRPTFSSCSSCACPLHDSRGNFVTFH